MTWALENERMRIEQMKMKRRHGRDRYRILLPRAHDGSRSDSMDKPASAESRRTIYDTIAFEALRVQDTRRQVRKPGNGKTNGEGRDLPGRKSKMGHTMKDAICIRSTAGVVAKDTYQASHGVR